MTALKQYEKIEAPGLWRETATSQRREVYVSFGNTSLVVHNNNEDVLSHWSLPAIQRLNPGKLPALFSPSPDTSETLEIDDSTIVDAIEEVRAAIERRRPHPGRLRLFIFAALTLSILALAYFWLPGALERHTIRVVPPETRQQIGAQILGHITRLTGNSCSSRQGDAALRRLAERILTNPRGNIVILADGITKSTHLPGGFILLNKNLIQDHERVEVAAGYVLMEQIHASTIDPLSRLLQHAGGIETLRLLTTGEVSDTALRAFAQDVLVDNRAMPEESILLKSFEIAGFASSPLAYAIDISGETTIALIEADPFLNTPYRPLLNDPDWVRLQTICGG